MTFDEWEKELTRIVESLDEESKKIYQDWLMELWAVAVAVGVTSQGLEESLKTLQHRLKMSKGDDESGNE